MGATCGLAPIRCTAGSGVDRGGCQNHGHGMRSTRVRHTPEDGRAAKHPLPSRVQDNTTTCESFPVCHLFAETWDPTLVCHSGVVCPLRLVSTSCSHVSVLCTCMYRIHMDLPPRPAATRVTLTRSWPGREFLEMMMAFMLLAQHTHMDSTQKFRLPL